MPNLSCISEIVLLTALAVLAVPAQTDVVRWRGDGTGIFADENPPVQWSDTANVRFRAALPNWSNSSPIVVGDRVFCMSEPVDYAPELVCLDAHDGSIRWRRQIDHLARMPGATAVRKTYREKCEFVRVLIGLLCEAAWLDRHDVAVDDPRRRDLAERVARYQASFDVDEALKKDMVVYSPLIAPYTGKRDTWLKQYGLVSQRLTAEKGRGKHYAEAYTYHGYSGGNSGTTWVGHGWPTPLCDGERVYALSAHNTVAAYDLDGDLAWMRTFPFPDEQRQKRLGLSGYPRLIAYSSSPVWADGKLITYMAYVMRAQDPATGEVVWTLDCRRLSPHQNNDLQVLDIDGIPVIAWSGGRLIDARNGEILADDLGVVGKGGGNFIGHHNMLFFNGKALRIVRDGDGITVETMWQGKGKQTGMGHGSEGIFAGQGLILAGPKGIEFFDATTGKEIRSSDDVPVYGPSLCLAGGRVYSGRWNEKGQLENPTGRQGVVEVGTARVLAINELHLMDPVGDKLQQIWRHGAIDGWRMFGAATPFIAHDRIYIRSYDELICIGR